MSETPEEIKIDKTFRQAVTMLEQLEKVFESNGPFLSAIKDIGGNTTYTNDVKRRLAKVKSDIKDAHYDALHQLENDEFKIRQPLPRVVEEVKQEEPVEEPIFVENDNEQSYSRIRAEAKEL